MSPAESKHKDVDVTLAATISVFEAYKNLQKDIRAVLITNGCPTEMANLMTDGALVGCAVMLTSSRRKSYQWGDVVTNRKA